MSLFLQYKSQNLPSLSIEIIRLYLNLVGDSAISVPEMPQCCAVPRCSSKTGGHKFPMRDKTRLKRWLKAIRRSKYIPTKNHVVCKKHFTADDYELPKESLIENPRLQLKKDAVPSKFPWNELTNDLLQKNNSERYERRLGRELNKSVINKTDKINNMHFVSTSDIGSVDCARVRNKQNNSEIQSACKININSGNSESQKGFNKTSIKIVKCWHVPIEQYLYM